METNSGFKDDSSTPAEKGYHQTNNRVIIGAIPGSCRTIPRYKEYWIFPDFIDNVIFSWPMLLIIIGVILTLGSRDKTAGIIVMAVGDFHDPLLSGKLSICTTCSGHLYSLLWE